jgi:predicted transcriptional regulator
MTHLPFAGLSRREREIMDVLHRLGRAGVHEVLRELSGSPAYSTVRAQLRVLEEKGQVRHAEEQLRYVYFPATSRQIVRRSALRHLLETFFDGSPEKVVEALVRDEHRSLSDDELERMARLIDEARREGRRPPP